MGIRSSHVALGGVRRLIAAVASAALSLFASPAHAEPAMWVVKDADSTIYLLGSFHLTKPDLNWRSGKIEAATPATSSLAESRPRSAAYHRASGTAAWVMMLGMETF